MITIHVLLLLLAFVFFLLSCFNVPGRINWMALGLALWVLAELLSGVGSVLR